jgi:hypothetical protein
LERSEALEAGYLYYCQDCITLYKVLPVALIEFLLGERPVPCCDKCGSDQIVRIEDDQEPETL